MAFNYGVRLPPDEKYLKELNAIIIATGAWLRLVFLLSSIAPICPGLGMLRVYTDSILPIRDLANYQEDPVLFFSLQPYATRALIAWHPFQRFPAV